MPRPAWLPRVVIRRSLAVVAALAASLTLASATPGSSPPAAPPMSEADIRATLARDLAEQGLARPATPFSDAFMTGLLEVPEFTARARSLSAPRRRALAMTLAARGVRRLDDQDLSRRANHLSQVLEQLDDSLCVRVAVGAVLTDREWSCLLAAMDRADPLGACAGDWCDAYRAAVIAELRHAPVPVPDAQVSGRAFASIRGALEPRELRVLERAWGPRGSVADFASGLRITYREVMGLDASERSALLRLLVS